MASVEVASEVMTAGAEVTVRPELSVVVMKIEDEALTVDGVGWAEVMVIVDRGRTWQRIQERRGKSAHDATKGAGEGQRTIDEPFASVVVTSGMIELIVVLDCCCCPLVVGAVASLLSAAAALDGWTTEVIEVTNVLCWREVVDGCGAAVELSC